MSTQERFLPQPEQEPVPLHPIAQAFLGKLARTADKKQRLTVLRACLKVRAAWVDEVLWESLADSCEEVRGFVFRTLVSAERIDLAHTRGRLHRPPWYARSAALRILGRRRVREAVVEIRRLLGDANADVRCAAAEALGDIGGKEAVGLLVRLRKDTNPYVRAAAGQGILKASDLRIT